MLILIKFVFSMCFFLKIMICFFVICWCVHFDSFFLSDHGATSRKKNLSASYRLEKKHTTKKEETVCVCVFT